MIESTPQYRLVGIYAEIASGLQIKKRLQLSKERTEFSMSLYAAFMEEESIQKSNSIKWGLKYGFSSGTSKLANRICFGYQHDAEGNLISEPQQAEIVRLIFTLYLEGKSLSGISKELRQRGIPSPTGKEIWTSRAIDKLLSNEKYIGNVLLQKTYVSSPFTKDQEVNDGILPQFLYENNHPGIIPPEMFEEVQNERRRRSRAKRLD